MVVLPYLVLASMVLIVSGLIILAVVTVRTLGTQHAGMMRGSLLALGAFVTAVAAIVQVLAGRL